MTAIFEKLILSGPHFDSWELPADSDFSGLKSAKVHLKDAMEMDNLLAVLAWAQNYDFVTIVNENNNASNNILLGTKTTAYLGDINVQLVKHDLKSCPESFAEIALANNQAYSESLLNICEKSFSLSRFSKDIHYPPDKAKQFHSNWAKLSFFRKDKYFILAKNNEDIVAFLLFRQDQRHILTIELIAVHPHFQKSGIGEKLMTTLEDYSYRAGIEKIRVGTQMDNKSALHLYSRKGFIFEKCNALYHLWPKLS